MRRGEFRIQRDRPGDVPRSLLEFAQRAEGNAAIGVNRGVSGTACDRHLDQSHRLAVVAALMRDDAAQMQCGFVAGMVAQQLPVQGVGGVQLARVMQADGAFQLLLVVFLIHREGRAERK